MQQGIRSVQFQYIPPTVEVLDLSGCAQTFLLETRHFPRSAKSILLVFNLLYGVPDLTTLPKNLEELKLAKNRLKGR
eukprot:CAMPEP_0201527958 /NCGR_PEP_ID=MMETSP0161_2-20130828/36912_1 /ASSEMBLY_ACC=CAM_ASM_000251 /TAXON_ID=180227 /ORGANISM="Neoparamoeba aestuarina, Strain SoJaBio B1-5/56/2" /LENGTH=76 /DNA_ID=CAMNT_0047929019 /DNA_START=201 /DNA_END=431 /DNA_ORIENTATION=-